MQSPTRPWHRCQIVKRWRGGGGYSACRRRRWHRGPHHELRIIDESVSPDPFWFAHGGGPDYKRYTP